MMLTQMMKLTHPVLNQKIPSINQKLVKKKKLLKAKMMMYLRMRKAVMKKRILKVKKLRNLKIMKKIRMMKVMMIRMVMVRMSNLIQVKTPLLTLWVLMKDHPQFNHNNNLYHLHKVILQQLFTQAC